MNQAQGHLTVHRKPKSGEQGIPGCIVRMSQWAEGVEYRNDESLTSGTRYIDYCIVTESANKFKCYQCLRTHRSSSTLTYSDPSYWQKFNTMQPVYTPLILAANAVMRMAQTNHLLVMDEDGTTTALGMGGGSYPFWVGAPTPDSAPAKISKEGVLISEGARIKKSFLDDVIVNGTFQAGAIDVRYYPSQVIPPAGTCTKLADAIRTSDFIRCSMGTSSTAVRHDDLPVAGETIGRRIYIQSTADLWINGTFMQNGNLKNSIRFKNELVELFCMNVLDEANNIIPCWNVVQSIKMSESSSSPLVFGTLAYGKVTVSGTARTADYKTFDGSVLKFRNAADGQTFIAIPDSWFPENPSYPSQRYRQCYVQLTAINNGAPLMVIVRGIYKHLSYGSCIEVFLADDLTGNDGAFYFEIKRMDL